MYLKQFREYLNLSQKEVAEITGMALSSILQYENGKTIPTITVILKYYEHFKANPNFLILGMGNEIIIDEDSIISPTVMEYIRNISFITSTEELTFELREVLVKKTLEKLISNNGYEKSVFEKLLEAIKFEGHMPFRPALFVYYMFRYVVENMDELSKQKHYKEYLIELVSRYNIKSFKNNPIFGNRVKKIITDNILHNLDEKDCKLILENPKKSLEILESKLTSTMVLAHKFIATKSLFPPLEK